MNRHQQTLCLPSPQTSFPEFSEEQEEWFRAIRSLNDTFRLSFTSSELHLSPKILAFDIETQAAIIDQVRNYRNFNPDNDPTCTHHQGFFQQEDQSIVWEIFCLTPDGKNLSEYPLDLNLTHRYIMIMCEEEYWNDLPESSKPC